MEMYNKLTGKKQVINNFSLVREKYIITEIQPIFWGRMIGISGAPAPVAFKLVSKATVNDFLTGKEVVLPEGSIIVQLSWTFFHPDSQKSGTLRKSSDEETRRSLQEYLEERRHKL